MQLRAGLAWKMRGGELWGVYLPLMAGLSMLAAMSGTPHKVSMKNHCIPAASPPVIILLLCNLFLKFFIHSFLFA